MDITAAQLDKLIEWVQTAPLPQLVIELQKIAARDIYADKNMEAVNTISAAIITRFNK